ncbi:LysR family transcriptional regulator [Edwardsiella ictaluri]
MSNPLQRIDVKTIALFCLIADNHSMSKTAELMHMTPSAVSKRIHELESITQLTLFQRLPGKMALTREGEALLREAGYWWAAWIACGGRYSACVSVSAIRFACWPIPRLLFSFCRAISAPFSISTRTSASC